MNKKKHEIPEIVEKMIKDSGYDFTVYKGRVLGVDVYDGGYDCDPAEAPVVGAYTPFVIKDGDKFRFTNLKETFVILKLLNEQ